MIRADERVAQVLARDERLLEVFAATSPAFQRLRNPALRRTMARLVTVEQAARIAGVDAAALVDRLNRALSDSGAATGTGADPPRTVEEEQMTTTEYAMPAALRSVPPERIVEADVREELRAGREPFSLIMAARRSLPEGGVLRVRAIFEPAPLYQVMAKQGFEHWTERLAADDWRVWFYPAEPSGSGLPPAAGAAEETPEEEDVVVLDVRGMEPPEPMVRTLAALAELPPGKTLVQINVRVPQHLLPRLEEQGFTYEIREQSEDLVRVFIRRSEG